RRHTRSKRDWSSDVCSSDLFERSGSALQSYLGARATIEALSHSFQNLLADKKRQAPQILFVGNHMSSTYIQDLFDVLENKDVSKIGRASCRERDKKYVCE